jgi:HNH endonuclease
VYNERVRCFNTRQSLIAERSDVTLSENRLPCACGNPSCEIPYGYCHCGCEQQTKPYRDTIKKRNIVSGQPSLFCRYHKRTIVIPNEVVPFEVEGDLCLRIPLTKGYSVIVDVYEYKKLIKIKWSTTFKRKDGKPYATCIPLGGGTSKRESMHRMIMGMPDGVEVDHINGDTLDNRRANLRLATRSQNGKNVSIRKSNKSGVKGVCWIANRWVAQITVNMKHLYLGRFRNIEDARKAYNEAAKKYHGEFARLS